MTEHVSTYVLVLAATYPNLKAALEKLMGMPLNSKNLNILQGSMIHETLVYDLEVIVQMHASNYNKIELCLEKVEEIIDHITNINYEHLNDDQKERLPDLAKRVDQVNYFVKEEIEPRLASEKENLALVLSEQLEHSMDYLSNLKALMNQSLAEINKTFNMNVKWTKGKKVLNWVQLRGWLSSNQKIDNKVKNIILGFNKEGSLSELLKSVLLMEVACVLSQSNAISQIGPVMEYIEKMTFKGVNFPRIEAKNGAYVLDMNESSLMVDALLEEIIEYPLRREEGGGAVASDLDEKTRDPGIFTTVQDRVQF